MTPAPRQLPLSVGWADTPDFDAFTPGDNAEALTAVRAVATGDGAPLFLHGGNGSGKSHLLQAAARAAHQAGRAAAYLPLSVYADSTPDVIGGFTHLQLIAVDECEAVWGRPEWAAALVRLLDDQRSRGDSLLLASRSAPSGSGASTLPDLRTRLSACAVFGLRPLNDAGRRDALQRRAHARGLSLGDEVADYLIRRLPRDLSSLMSALDTLDKASLSAQRRLTIPFVQQCLPATPAPVPTSARTESGQ